MIAYLSLLFLQLLNSTNLYLFGRGRMIRTLIYISFGDWSFTVKLFPYDEPSAATDWLTGLRFNLICLCGSFHRSEVYQPTNSLSVLSLQSLKPSQNALAYIPRYLFGSWTDMQAKHRAMAGVQGFEPWPSGLEPRMLAVTPHSYICYCSLRFSNSWTTRCLRPMLLMHFHIVCLITLQ